MAVDRIDDVTTTTISMTANVQHVRRTRDNDGVEDPQELEGDLLTMTVAAAETTTDDRRRDLIAMTDDEDSDATTSTKTRQTHEALKITLPQIPTNKAQLREYQFAVRLRCPSVRWRN
jgi:DNA-directed RNA polymerase delta subunit